MKRKPQIQREPKPPLPAQTLEKPGLESKLKLRPRYKAPLYLAAGKLKKKIALITGGDSGIGRAVAYLFAREGADVAITCLPEERSDAQVTMRAIRKLGRKCLVLDGNLREEAFCYRAVEDTIDKYGKIDILVSNAGYQNRKETITDITYEEWDATFKTNIYAYFNLAKAAVPHMRPGSAIIATSSETSYLGPKTLLDYASTKGAINTFTKSLAQMLIDKGIRVNAVAPGPVWTPLNPADSGNTPKKVAQFGKHQPIKRPAQPEELAPTYVFLASDPDSSYISGAIIPVMGALPAS